MRFSLIRTTREAGNVISLYLQPAKPLTWTAGQFIHYTLPATDERRYFTIASAPHTGVVQITTRVTDSAFKQSLANLHTGDTLEGTPPDGDFVWQEDEQPKLWLAEGVGITPFHSMLLQRDYTGEPLNVTLLYANRTPQDVIFGAELEDLASRHDELRIHYLKSPLTLAAIQNIIPHPNQYHIYLAGPEHRVETLGNQLRTTHHLTPDQLKQDFFPYQIDLEKTNK